MVGIVGRDGIHCEDIFELVGRHKEHVNIKQNIKTIVKAVSLCLHLINLYLCVLTRILWGDTKFKSRFQFFPFSIFLYSSDMVMASNQHVQSHLEWLRVRVDVYS